MCYNECTVFGKEYAEMKKVFNVTADCKPDLHYMVNLDERLAEIKQLVDCEAYFTINRARQIFPGHSGEISYLL